MRWIFPLLVAAAAVLAVGIMYLFVLSGETSHTGAVPQAQSPAR